MNSFSIFAFLLCVAVSFCLPAEEKYTNKYDNFDYKAVLNSKRLVIQYVNCVVTGNGCTAEGKTLREYLPDVLKTNCAKCTDKQRIAAFIVINGLEKDHPDQLKRVLDKFDKDRKLWEAFKKANGKH